MVKTEFVKEINHKSNVPYDQIFRVLSAMDEVILEVIANEDSVRFSWGIIKGVCKPAQTARNPKTGETVDVPEKHGYPRVKFTAAAKA